MGAYFVVLLQGLTRYISLDFYLYAFCVLLVNNFFDSFRFFKGAMIC